MARQLKIAAKWAAKFDYYKTTNDWIEDQWTHLTFTWAAGNGFRAYLNGCDMDADDSRGYAYDMERSEQVSSSLPGNAGNVFPTTAG